MDDTLSSLQRSYTDSTDEELLRLQTLATTASPLPVIGIAALLINVYCAEGWRRLAYLALIGLMMSYMRGLTALFHPEPGAAGSNRRGRVIAPPRNTLPYGSRA